jgi:hypothetical protein
MQTEVLTSQPAARAGKANLFALLEDLRRLSNQGAVEVQSYSLLPEKTTL